MAEVIITRRATQNLALIGKFYAQNDPDLAVRVVETILQGLRSIGIKPLAGRPSLLSDILRERIIPFGAKGFVVLYEHRATYNQVIISAIRHQRQVGYPEEER
jgi:plasmid stabilization system protein ParE